MSNRKIGISIGILQEIYGDRKALEIAAHIGADSVDFATHRFDKRVWDYREPTSIYAQGGRGGCGVLHRSAQIR